MLKCWRLLGWGLCACAVIALVGCGGGSYRRGGVTGTKPYTVRGKTYYPLKSAHGFVEVGTASWYGPGFHGKTTANGERYNMYAMTAAHKLLPLGTNVKVTHLGNGRSVVVRINDRGPFVEDRVIDLSRTAATKLGMREAGTARVRIQSLGGVPNMYDDGDLEGDFYIQLGSFATLANANAIIEKLRKQGLPARLWRSPSSELWHVQAGPWKNSFAAQKFLPTLLRQFRGAFVVGE